MRAFCLLVFIALLGGCSCNNAAEPTPTAVDTAVTAVDSAQTIPEDTGSTRPIKPPVVDTGKAAPFPLPKDSTIKKPVVSSQKKSAVLGYSYFNHMKQEETRNIYVYVQSVTGGIDVNRLEQDIKAALQEANSQVKPERKSDTASYFTTSNIYYYKYLTIKLNDPGGHFSIDSLGTPSRQQIDSNENNSWQWAVTPKTSVTSARLIIQVTAETENGQQKTIGTREIAINIQLEMNFWRSVITWLINTPEKLLVLIIIPLAIYFGRKIFDRNKQRPSQP